MPPSLWASAAEPTSLMVHKYTGQVLAREEKFNVNMRRKYDAPFLDIHRVDLQQALYSRAKELGVVFKMGQKVENVDFTVPSITTNTGLSASADLIVAADGLWSRSRTLFAPEAEGPRPTGDLAYRIVLDLDQVRDPDLRLWISNPTVHFWIGPGAHAVGYSLRGGNMYNIVLLVPDTLPDGVSRQAGSVDEMKALFEGWDPILTRFLNMVDNVDKWKLMHSKCRSW
jgi:salicylate hydroxylase